jgi:chromosomal replication initiation ATPase DnaA
MDALRQSILRAQLAKPLPGRTQSGGSEMPAVIAVSEMSSIDARVSALDKKLDTLIHMLNGPGRKQKASPGLLPAEVRRAVARFFDVTDEELDRRTRSVRMARIRQIAFYLCRTHTMRSLPAIGRAFDRDHTTVLHGARRVASLRETDAGLDRDLAKLEAQLADLIERRGLMRVPHAGS